MSAQSFAIKAKRTSKPARRSSGSSSSAKHLAQPVIKPTRKLPIQAKLTIGQPNDKYEQEADRVADQVMRMSDADVAQRVEIGTVQPLRIQRMCPECEEEMAQRQPMEEEEEELQAKEMPGQTPTVAPNLESRINSLKGGGQPLDPATRSFFEPRFGQDFSYVRVHTDSNASETAKSVNARAFTLGNNVVFGSGEYHPGSAAGKCLLGHELTHVIQQGSSDNQKIQRDDHENLAQQDSWVDLTASDGHVASIYFPTNRSDLDSDDLAVMQQVRQELNIALLGRSVHVEFLGYADWRGTEGYNSSLSMRRTSVVFDYFDMLNDYSTGYDAIAFGMGEHGSPESGTTSEELEDYRRVDIVVSPAFRISTHQPVPPSPPAMTPTPSPSCWSGQEVIEYIIGTRQSLIHDFISCFCLADGVLDLIDAAPVLAPASPVIEGIDCGCNILTIVQETSNRFADGGCWSASNFSFGDFLALLALSSVTAVDCLSLPVGAALGAAVFGTGGVAGGASAGSLGGPTGTVGGGGAGGVAGAAFGAAFGDFIVDLAAMGFQNMITQGTPLPQNQCNSCLRVARAVNIPIPQSWSC